MFLTTYKPNRSNSLNNLFNDFNTIFTPSGYPKVNWKNNSTNYVINSDDDSVTLTMNVPGYNKKLVDVSVHNDILSIEGKSNSGDTEGFSYQFDLNDKLDASNIDASVIDGVLSVTVPYLESVQPKRIEVKVR